MKTKIKITACLTAMLIVSGCSQGFKGTGSSDNGNGGLSNPGGSTSWANLKMEGAVKEGKYENRKLISLDKANKLLLIKLPSLALPVLIGNMNQTITIPELPGASIKTEVASDGNVDVVLAIPLSYVMRGASFLPEVALPNGDPLPAIPDGELPGLAINLNLQGTVKVYLYLGVGTIGAYVTTPFNPMVSMQLPIYQDNGATIGYLTTVPEKGSYAGGLFMSFRMPADIARIIDDVI